MKKVIYSLAVMFALVGFTSCDYDSKDDAKITYYVSIELEGDEVLQVPVGTEFVDPGYKAIENGEDVTSKVVVGGDEVDADQVGIYHVTYSAKNVDGFSKSVSRTVVVYNPDVTTNISGTYTVEANTLPRSVNGNPVTLTELAPGLYSISDWWGGLYDVTIGYGAAYRATGYLQLNEDNTIEGISGSSVWGDETPFEYATGSYNPATDKVSLEVDMLYQFTMTMGK